MRELHCAADMRGRVTMQQYGIPLALFYLGNLFIHDRLDFLFAVEVSRNHINSDILIIMFAGIILS